MTRVGLVGYGMAGRDIHTPLLSAAGCQVVAVATSAAARVTQAHADLPHATVVADLDELLERSGELALDLVVLASPSGAHHVQALAVIAAGLPLVVDKPLAVDAGQAQEITAAAAAAGVPLTVFQNLRHDPDLRTLAGLVAGGALGQVLRAEMRWERWRPDLGSAWRETLPAAQGGGVLLDLHSHMVDDVVQLFGPVRSVYAELAARDAVAEDEAFLSCHHAGGVVSHLGVSTRVAAAGPRWRVLGTEGTYLIAAMAGEAAALSELVDEDGHCGWLYRHGEPRRAVPAARADRTDFYRAVAAALASGDSSALPVDPRDAVHVLAVLDAARHAARTGHREPVG